jgi:ribosomal protein S12 methylthiotransferase accessory factor YcaO
MRIHSAPKVAAACSERAVPVEVTLARARRAAAAAGVTRLADITGLDRLGIPVHTSVVPKSDDSISVYNGKGLHPDDSKTGALMEAIERQTALHVALPVTQVSHRTLHRGKRAVIDPAAFNQKLRDDYAGHRAYLWTEAFDLIQNERVMVPAAAVGYGPRYGHTGSPFVTNSSNGLASGNCFEEAVCHALCELVERDAFTLAQLRAHWIPKALRDAMMGPGTSGADDADAYPRIELASAGEPFSGLLARFERAGLRLVVRDITSDIGIATAVAAVADDTVPGFPQAHGGMGTHPNARIAVVRAITELAQSRVVDIQGAREDIVAAGETAPLYNPYMQRARRIERGSWLFAEAGGSRRLEDMASIENGDIAEDIHLILDRLTRQGIGRVLVADVSGTLADFKVVRAMAPGLEYWGVDRERIGPRALAFWNRHVS